MSFKILQAFAAAVVLGLLPGGLTAKDDVLLLNGSGPWNVDFGDNYCGLNLALEGQDTGPGFFALTMDPVPTSALVKIAVPSERTRKAKSGRADVFINGSQAQADRYSYRYHADDHKIWAFSVDLESHDLEREISSFEFRTDYDGVVSVSVSQFKQAMDVMDQCLLDLHKQLGVDTEALAKMAVPPKDAIYKFIDLPRMTRGLEFTLLYTVDVDGGVLNCHLLKPSGKKEFDKRVCDDLKEKARFEPALDEAGQPISVPQYQALSVRQVQTITSSSIR